ncbi:DeoR/GlpR family DNA-binding transcription regulator [Vibrio sp. VB16]|uniref:DeoR/GlpR family DNA-binding transcription regulator n=1 Tax=Vibrio sp. VB16 TaxID=2785746 RepID=UPI0018A01FBA|nr:DeoR/GlpR family DNA-binding transcription regulator [Vibrio sp. VB16]UGA53674.1 DeoR/GlpR family DNA-binding transcription regulator [Vibrio sp. VB16]
MSNDYHFAAARQKKIINLIDENQSVKLSELRVLFGVSEATIRRDLVALEGKKTLTRTYGGAVANLMVSEDSSNEDRSITNVEEKLKISKAACTLISEGQTVFIDSGTTAIQLASVIPKNMNCIYVTNCRGVANELFRRGIMSFYLIGGSYLAINDSFVGTLAVDVIRSLSFDISFLCTSGVDVHRQQISLRSDVYRQSQREVIAVSQQNYVLADHSKFNAKAFFSSATFDQIDGVITSNLISNEMRDKLAKFPMKVIYAGG